MKRNNLQRNIFFLIIKRLIEERQKNYYETFLVSSLRSAKNQYGKVMHNFQNKACKNTAPYYNFSKREMKMYYTDSHIHLQDYTPEEAKNVMTAAIKADVREFIVPSSNPTDWQKIIDLTKQYSDITGAIGIHPWCVENTEYFALDILENLLIENPKLWLGECGIDRIKNPNIDRQREFFIKQIELATRYNRPLIIHSVKADDKIGEFFSILPKRTIFHSFTGSLEWGKKIQKAGFYLGINFTFFRKESAAETLQNLDLSKILIETDAPYQQIKGFVKNSPENLPILVLKIAEALNLSIEEISSILAQNRNTFKQPKTKE